MYRSPSPFDGEYPQDKFLHGGGFDYQNPYDDIRKAEHLGKAEANAHIGEGKYLCSRCGKYVVQVECKTCRRLYCQGCSDQLHSRPGEYGMHRLRAFDPVYEANKRVRKRGTKFDSNAPVIGVSSGAGLSSWPLTSLAVIAASFLVILLAVIAVSNPGWSHCSSPRTTNTDSRTTKIGPWRTCLENRCEGTLLFAQSSIDTCPITEFKKPVNLSRIFTHTAIFFAIMTIVAIIVGQVGRWHKIAILKASAICSFIACFFFMLAIAMWLYAMLGDVRCRERDTQFPIVALPRLDRPRGLPLTTNSSITSPFTFNDLFPRGNTDNDDANGGLVGQGNFALIDINPYGVRGHCEFQWGFYFMWLCAIVSFWAAVAMFDWFRGLPVSAQIAVVIVMITQILCIVSFTSNYWTKGKLENSQTEAWAGLWRYCVDTSSKKSPALDHECYPIGDWVTSTDPCLKKDAFLGIRACLLVALFVSISCYVVIFYAHTFRKPKVLRFGGPIAASLMIILYFIPVVMHPVMVNQEHQCLGVTYDDIPFGGIACTDCHVAWSWGLVLANLFLSIILLGLFAIARVGFEQDKYLDQSPTPNLVIHKPGNVSPYPINPRSHMYEYP